MLPATQRVRARREFAAIFARGRAIPGSAVFLKYHPNRLGHPRFGIVVSNKVSKRAVARNLIKRRIREILRAAIRDTSLGTLGVDVIVITRPAVAALTFVQLREVVQSLLSRITLPPPRS